MKFSVVIPTLNSASTLHRAVSSILKQTLTREEVEIILVDDGSTDETSNVSVSIAKSHGSVVLLSTAKAESGPGVARNIGVEAATGDWLVFVDSDDEMAEGALATLRQSASDPQVDVIAYNWRYGDSGPGNSYLPAEGREDLDTLRSDKDALLRAFLRSRIDQSAIFNAYRSSFLRAVGLRFRQGYHEDVDFTFAALLLAGKIRTVRDVVYIKWNRVGSIVNTIGVKHVEGYFDACLRILEILNRYDGGAIYSQDFREFLISVAASRLARLLRIDIAKVGATYDVLAALHARVTNALALLPEDMGLLASSPLETRHHKVFNAFMAWGRGPRDTEATERLLEDIRQLQEMSWSCYDIHHSVFLAPDEIRTCCKRYYHNGKMMGDVVLLRSEGSTRSEFGYETIRAAKAKLHREINRNSALECEGCPFLSFGKWGAPLDGGVKYLSLEYHSVCNMRCTYCNPTYYGGKKAAYDVEKLVTSIADTGNLQRNEYIVWGGGEPVLDKHFPVLAERLAAAVPNVKQRVITNCTRYSSELAQMMANDQAYIVVSLDAGTQRTFQEIRGYKGFDRVMRNVQRYVNASAENTTIKYIVMPENSGIGELESYIELLSVAGVLAANFQISCDFRSERLSLNEIAAVATLASALLEQAHGHVFVDDLVWQRIPPVTEELHDRIAEILDQRGLSHALATDDHHPELAVWGTGAHARLMMEKSFLLRNVRIPLFIDPRPGVAGQTLRGAPIAMPEALLRSSLPVLIAAVQASPTIYSTLKKMGLGPDRIVRKLVL